MVRRHAIYILASGLDPQQRQVASSQSVHNSRGDRTLNLSRALSKGKAAGGLKVYVTGDGSDVYEDTFMKLAKEDGTSFQPVLILVGIRLGIDRVTPVYWDALKMSLQLPQSIGIAGSVYGLGN